MLENAVWGHSRLPNIHNEVDYMFTYTVSVFHACLCGNTQTNSQIIQTSVVLVLTEVFVMLGLLTQAGYLLYILLTRLSDLSYGTMCTSCMTAVV